MLSSAKQLQIPTKEGMPSRVLNTTSFIDMMTTRTSLFSAFRNLLLMILIISLSFAYVFDIANQVMGVLEDKLNKASRPIPAGLISYQQGQRRWIIAWLFFPAFAFLIGGPKQQQSLYYGRPRCLYFTSGPCSMAH